MEDDPVRRIPELTGGPEDELTVTTGGARLKTPGPKLLESGAVLDARYQVEAMIGEGGTGAVFRAWDRVLGETVAVKILHPARAQERSWIKRLAREVRVARAIRHPNVCRVFELGHADGHWFVTMELATGGTLRQLLRDPAAGGDAPALRPLPARLADARAVCAGLAAIHAVGIIHRDVTPQNILRMADGRLVISDFGLAVERDDNTTVHGGTPAYMPPEAIMGERSDQRSDVWQAGALVHEILFGRRPEWDRTARGVVMRWPLPADASPVEEELAALCGDCLSQDPAARPPTAIAVVGRLEAAEHARPRAWPARIWLRARAQLRRRPWLLAAAAVAALAALAVQGVRQSARPPLCRGGPARVAGIWDAHARDEVRRAFVATQKPYAADAFTGVDRAIQRYLEAWVGMYTESCEATQVRGEQSAEVLDLRTACLDDRLHGVRALGQLFAQADGDVVGNALSATTSLGGLDRCADVKLLRAVVEPPGDPQLRERVDGLRRRLTETKVARDAGRIKNAMKASAAITGDARKLDYAPVLAEALALQGELEIVAGDPKKAEAILLEGFWTAEAARDDEIKAEISVYEIDAVGYRQSHYEEAERWVRQTQATLRRLGGHERMQAWVETNTGGLDNLQGKFPEALRAFQRALAIAERALRPDDPDVARPLGNLAMALSDNGRPAEALAQNQRALDIFRKAYGPAHPEVALHLSNRGEILNALGRWGEARAAFAGALAIWGRELPADHPYLAYPLNGTGESLIGEGSPERALAPLERALAIRERGESDPARVAETRFALARALWESAEDRGQNRPRALALAQAAKTAYAGLAPWRAKAAIVDRWLAARQTDEAQNTRPPGRQGRR
jgi:tetratricopeptide (TPR) repeat protein/tRNA A-37 threonylcarbamoyl transferase component Bud32